MFNVLIVIVLAAFAAGGIWAFIVTRKVKRNGIETEAVISRIEIHEWSGEIAAPDNVGRDYYITYVNQNGESVEALLGDSKVDGLEEGHRLKIRYLPDRQEYPVLIEIL